jgi:hypothetical protein
VTKLPSANVRVSWLCRSADKRGLKRSGRQSRRPLARRRTDVEQLGNSGDKLRRRERLGQQNAVRDALRCPILGAVRTHIDDQEVEFHLSRMTRNLRYRSQVLEIVPRKSQATLPTALSNLPREIAYLLQNMSTFT